MGGGKRRVCLEGPICILALGHKNIGKGLLLLEWAHFGHASSFLLRPCAIKSLFGHRLEASWRAWGQDYWSEKRKSSCERPQLGLWGSQVTLCLGVSQGWGGRRTLAAGQAPCSWLLSCLHRGGLVGQDRGRPTAQSQEGWVGQAWWLHPYPPTRRQKTLSCANGACNLMMDRGLTLILIVWQLLDFNFFFWTASISSYY